MPRALIAGLGLVGGSMGMALRRRGWRVAYIDPGVEQQDALDAGAADERVRDYSEEADLVVLAMPVDRAIAALGELPPRAATSVCSIMLPLRRIADERGLPFIAGHPMAGSHESGLRAARADLFTGRRWFVERSDALVDRLITDCGGERDIVDAAEHDDAVALTSHLAQILSTALAATLEERHIRFAGPGLRTFLRLAASEAHVWKPLLEANREQIESHAGRLLSIVRRMVEGDPTEAFDAAREMWKKLEEPRS